MAITNLANAVVMYGHQWGQRHTSARCPPPRRRPAAAPLQPPRPPPPAMQDSSHWPTNAPLLSHHLPPISYNFPRPSPTTVSAWRTGKGCGAGGWKGGRAGGRRDGGTLNLPGDYAAMRSNRYFKVFKLERRPKGFSISHLPSAGGVGGARQAESQSH